jgi:hypothetical protein
MPKTYQPIATQTLGSAVSTITFSSIAATYTDLIAVINGTTTVGAQNIRVRFNGDTSALYSRTSLYGDGTSAASTRDSGDTALSMFYYGTTQATGICNVMNYANTTTFMTTISRSNDTSTALNANANLYRSTSAITSMTFFIASGNFSIGSTFTLYGIKAA